MNKLNFRKNVLVSALLGEAAIIICPIVILLLIRKGFYTTSYFLMAFLTGLLSFNCDIYKYKYSQFSFKQIVEVEIMATCLVFTVLCFVILKFVDFSFLAVNEKAESSNIFFIVSIVIGFVVMHIFNWYSFVKIKKYYME